VSFPQTVLDLKSHILVNGVWQDISTYVYQRQPPAVTITRGRPDGAQSYNPATAVFELNNRDNRFSMQNPTGTYYPNLSRNTPLRFSVPSATTALRFADDALSFISTPNSTGLNITGDLEIQFDANLDSYMPSILISKWLASGNQRAWAVVLNANGTIGMILNNNGFPANTFVATSSLPLPLNQAASIGRMAIKVTIAVATGTIKFYTAPTIAGTWTQLGNTIVTGGFTFPSTTSAVTIGHNPDTETDVASFNSVAFFGCRGRVYAAKVLSGIGGTVEASPDFTTSTPGNTTLTDAQSNVWTLSGTAEFSNRNYRFHGELSDMPQRWDAPGKDVWVPVNAAGILRRLGQGNPVLMSTMKRAWLTRGTSGGVAPIAYWPCEDGSQATLLGPALGQFPLFITAGQANLASDSSFNCSQPLPVLNGSIWTGQVNAYTPNNDLVVRFLLKVPVGTSTADGSILMKATFTGNASFSYMVVKYRTGGALQIQVYDHTGFPAVDSGSQSFGILGNESFVSAELRPQGGGNTKTFLYVANTNGSALQYSSGLFGSGVTGVISTLQFGDGTVQDAVIGHAVVQPVWENPSLVSVAFNANNGEAAALRFARLCSENNIPCHIRGIPSLSVAMGPQTPLTLLELLQECEDSDQGMISDARSALAVTYRTLASLCNQPAALSLDYSQAHYGLSSDDQGITPTTDDQLTKNDVIITRKNGAVYQITLSDGTAMSIGKIGDYQFTNSVSLNLDTQLADVTNWILHVGTVNESRYPAVPLNLARAPLASLQTAIIEMSLGDMLSGVNFPVWTTPDQIRKINWGYTEQLGGFMWNLILQTRPASVYDTLIAGSGATSDNRADTDGSTLQTGVNTVATSLSVLTTNSQSPLWTTIAGDFPFDIMMGGERMTVTNITGASSPQTFTVTRSVNGVVKSHLAGEAINVFAPVYVALI
jgi:hypothetical protein